MRIFAGQAPYTEFFAFYGPLAYVIPAGFVKLFGSIPTGVFVLELMVAILSSLVSYLLARRISGRPLGALLAPLALVLLGATTARSLPALAAVWFLALYEERRRPIWLVCAGSCGGLALLWIQDAGAWLVVATLVVAVLGIFWRQVRDVLGLRHLGWVLLGGLTVMLPAFVYLLLERSLTQWIYWTFIFPNAGYTNRSATGYLSSLVSSWAGQSLPALLYHAIFYLLPYIAIVVAALVCVVIAIVRLRRVCGLVPVATTVLAIYGLLQLRVLLASLDEAKLADTAAPTVTCSVGLALAYLAIRRPVRGKSRRWVQGIPAVAAVLTLAWLLVWPAQITVHGFAKSGSIPAPESGTGMLSGLPFGAAAPPATNASQLDQLILAIRTFAPPEEPIFVTPTSPMIYVAARRANPTRFDYLDPIYTTAAVDAELAADVASKRPAVIVVGASKFTEGGRTFTPEAIAPRTYGAVVKNYHPVRVLGPWTVLVPNGPR